MITDITIKTSVTLGGAAKVIAAIVTLIERCYIYDREKVIKAVCAYFSYTATKS